MGFVLAAGHRTALTVRRGDSQRIGCDHCNEAQCDQQLHQWTESIPSCLERQRRRSKVALVHLARGSFFVRTATRQNRASRNVERGDKKDQPV